MWQTRHKISFPLTRTGLMPDAVTARLRVCAALRSADRAF